MGLGKYLECFSNTLNVFWTFLKLGLTSFGGPVAHLSFYHDEFVDKKKWIKENAFADLVALCQSLPGPTSSQLGIAIGLTRAGYSGSIAAWLGFTLPSAVFMSFLAVKMKQYPFFLNDLWTHGVKIAATAVVAHAIYLMAKRFCLSRTQIAITVFSAVVLFFVRTPLATIGVILISSIMGALFLTSLHAPQSTPNLKLYSKKIAFISLILYFGLLLILPFCIEILGLHSLNLFSSFFRSGALVFGGGHVVLPLLQGEFVRSGLITRETFLFGYGAAQTIPGPLFTFAAFIGASLGQPPNGAAGALIAISGIFLPSFLLIWGVFPFWEKLRYLPSLRNALSGVNASVVGILFAAFCGPVWSSAIYRFEDAFLVLILFLLLWSRKIPSWGVVLLGATVGHWL